MSEQEVPQQADEVVEPAEQVTEDAHEVVEEVEAAEEAGEPVTDPLDEFKAKLRRQEGEWFVIHTYAGYENKVKANLESRAQTMNAEEDIFEVQVPMEEVMEVKNTAKKLVRRVRVPGYALVRMNLTDETWGVVRHTPGVTGFVGQDAYNPVPLRLDEVVAMLAPVFEAEQAEAGAAPKAEPQVETGFEIGEAVTVKDGPFEGMPATISEINAAASSMVVLISVFERETPVTLNFSQVTKM
ncbi:transcription termination/antitermination factor NusG [Rothia nasimurium]|uniref:Transcription termination/antitermination protein NusG n=1 Tax=Rothia nasimurium TaxID=85336 RepID=A0A1Y1RRS1_9MICC|nr:transcription termination/antitermination protein NusG [Rothia nasimurium]ORC24361.1 transcription termination/antitermination factor NusG [Rothia nasimurium]